MTASNLKILFLPNGGFNQNGAFIEFEGDAPKGNEEEYERQGNLSMSIKASEFIFSKSFGVSRQLDTEFCTSKNKKIISKGTIQQISGGKFELSIIGEKISFEEIEIYIHETKNNEDIFFMGSNHNFENGDKFHKFFIEIHIKEEKFSELLNELKIKNTILMVNLRSHCFPNFYSTWSPGNDGRIVKYLKNKDCVINKQDIPDSFWRTPEEQNDFLSDHEYPPVFLSVSRDL